MLDFSSESVNESLESWSKIPTRFFATRSDLSHISGWTPHGIGLKVPNGPFLLSFFETVLVRGKKRSFKWWQGVYFAALCVGFWQPFNKHFFFFLLNKRRKRSASETPTPHFQTAIFVKCIFWILPHLHGSWCRGRMGLIVCLFEAI